MKGCRALLLLLLAICSAAFSADTADTGAMTIGRLFMSPEQRTELDRLRKIRPDDGTAAAPGAPTTTADPGNVNTPDASGFIIRAEGETYLWVDGDFRTVSPDRVQTERPNDNMNITRHGRPAAGDERKPSVLEHADNESP